MILILLSLSILIYIYFAYPLIICLWSIIFNKKHKKENITPFVSLIITVYNEQDVIEDKIINSLKLDYPEDKLEIILASDGSTDNTVNIVKKYSSVKLLAFKDNEGKTETQNKAVKEAEGEIIVFSDANTMYKSDALRKLVRNFADKRVGVVCGELIYRDILDNSSGSGEGLYWKYEKFIKRCESKIYSVLGVNGGIYALRKSLYIPLPADIISDFVEPLMIVKNGYRAVYETEAVAYEKPEENFSSEFRRKVRIITRGLFGLYYVRDIIKLNFIGFAVISHKLLRWLVPVFLIIVLLSNIVYHKGIFFYLLLGQVIFYLFALLGLKYKKRIFYIPAYFVLVNYAALLGLINFIKGKKYVSWKTSDRK